MDMLPDHADGVAFEVFQVVTVLLDNLRPVRVLPGAGLDRGELPDPDLAVPDGPGAEPVFELHDRSPVRVGSFEPELLAPHPSLPLPVLNAGLEVEDPGCYVLENVRECLRGEIKRVLPRHRVKGEPAKPVAVGDHEVCPVHASGLVEEEDRLDRDVPEPFADEVFYKCHIRGKRRPYVVRLEEFDLPAIRTAGAGPSYQRDVAPVAPVEDLFYRRLVRHIHMIGARGR